MRLVRFATVIEIRILKSTDAGPRGAIIPQCIDPGIIGDRLAPGVVAHKLEPLAELVPILNDQRVVKGIQIWPYHIDIAKPASVIRTRRVKCGVPNTAAEYPSGLVRRQVDVHLVLPFTALRSGVGYRENVTASYLLLDIEKHALIVGQRH